MTNKNTHSDKMLQIAVIEPGKLLRLDYIKKGLEALQEGIEGNIDMYSGSDELLENEIDLIFNDDNKCFDMEPTILIVKGGGIVDYICGNVILAGYNKKGDTISLTDNQIELIKSKLQYYEKDNKIFHVLAI